MAFARRRAAVLAADALGRIGGEDAQRALRSFDAAAADRDVVFHVCRDVGRARPLDVAARGQLPFTSDASIGAAHVGRPAPEFVLEDAAGRSWSLPNHRGTVVVVVFLCDDG